MSKGWAALSVAALLFVGAVVGTALTRPARKVVHPVVVTPIVPSPMTPLPRDSGPKNNEERPHRSGASRQTPRASDEPATSQSPTLGTQNRRVPVKTRPAPRRKARRPAAPQRPAQPSQPPNPQPPPRRPPSAVELNPPVGPTVCNPLVSVRCP